MIFVDSSFWIAVRDSDDAHHAASTELLKRYGDESLVTSNQIRGETWTLTRRRYGFSEAVSFLDRLERTPRVRVHFVSEELDQQAVRWLRRHGDRDYSYVDATSFALMRALRIREALTFDRDFETAGFTVLSAD